MEVAEAYLTSHYTQLQRSRLSVPSHPKVRLKLICIRCRQRDVLRCRNLARRCVISVEVIITTAVAHTELSAAYRFAAINIFASFCEKCPNILVDAFDADLPVLSFNVMPMSEFARDIAKYCNSSAMISVLGYVELKSSSA